MLNQRGVIAALFALVSVCLLAASGALTAQVPTPPAQPEAERFYDAIRSGDIARVRTLVDGGADVNLVERRGGATPLMHAAAIGSLDTMRLLLDKGASVNAKSYGGVTPLMWAVADLAKVRLLVERGADVNITSASGRTALMLAAMSDNSAPIVRFLLDRGANARAVDNAKFSTVLAASVGNDTESIRLLTEAGGDVNLATSDEGDFPGVTALMNAAGNGNLEAVRYLLAKGAKVNAVTGPPAAPVKNGIVQLGTFTPLLLASTYGPDALVKALIAAGADVNVKDARGMTPLMLAVSADHGDPDVVKTLLTSGANAQPKSLAGETVLDWALKAGQTPRVAMLRTAGAPTTGPGAAAARPAVSRAPSVRAAVERSLALIQPASGKFFVNGGCGSCHAQNATDIAVGEARAARIPVDVGGIEQRAAGASAQFASIATRLLERFDFPVVDIPEYAVAALAAVDHPADRATDALVFNITAIQAANGSWHRSLVARPPLADGDTSSTALGIRALAVYGPPGRRAEMNERIRKAMDFLRAVKPITAEDRAYRMMGLLWGGARPQDLSAYVRDAQGAQHPDGGWSQNATLQSDAYATSIMLYALVKAGVPATDGSVTRAVNYLLASQHADGSWYVRSRAPKFQPYFDGGFPHEHDQWISAMATGWATAALSSTIRADATRQAAR